MHEFLVSTAAFVVLVGLMVIVHEFGHFAVAKLCRVRVEAFSFGFGPRLFGFKYGETDYRICLLPLGGYVKMTGETPDQVTGAPEAFTADEAPTGDPGSFNNHPRWQRILIGLAGPGANFVLALVLMVFYYGWINEVPSVQINSTTVDWVTPDSSAALAGFQPGDVITRFDNAADPDWMKVYEGAKLNAGQPVPVTVERGGSAVNLTLTVPAAAKSDDFDVTDAGLQPQILPGPIAVQQMVAHPAKLDATGYKLGFISVLPPYRENPLPIGAAFNKATGFCADNSFLIVEVLQRIFTHKIAVSQLAGPVGIARMAGDAAEMNGWLPKFGLAGEISLNLGILNLMPFPILDGGLIILLLIESVIRRDISINVKERIYQAAFVVLVAFFVFIIFNDVTKLPIFTHLKP
jgi:regulator of sigma E protease